MVALVEIIGVCQLQTKGQKPIGESSEVCWGPNYLGKLSVIFILFLVWEEMVKRNFSSKNKAFPCFPKAQRHPLQSVPSQQIEKQTFLVSKDPVLAFVQWETCLVNRTVWTDVLAAYLALPESSLWSLFRRLLEWFFKTCLQGNIQRWVLILAGWPWGSTGYLSFKLFINYKGTNSSLTLNRIIGTH